MLGGFLGNFRCCHNFQRRNMGRCWYSTYLLPTQFYNKEPMCTIMLETKILISTHRWAHSCAKIPVRERVQNFHHHVHSDSVHIILARSTDSSAKRRTLRTSICHAQLLPPLERLFYLENMRWCMEWLPLQQHLRIWESSFKWFVVYHYCIERISINCCI